MATVDFRKAAARANAKRQKKKVASASGTSALGKRLPDPRTGIPAKVGVRDTAAGDALGVPRSGGLKPAATLTNVAPRLNKFRSKKPKPVKGTRPTQTPKPAAPSGTAPTTARAAVSTRNAVAVGSSGPGVSPSTTSTGAKRRKTGGGPASTTAASPASTVAPGATGPDSVETLFGAAQRDIERRQQIAEQTRLNRLQDQKAFDQWVLDQRGRSDQSLSNAFAKSAADATAARQQSLDAVNRYAGEATRQASGVQGIMDAAGQANDLTSYGFRQDATAADSAGAAFTQAALSQRQNQQQEGDRARAANMVSSYNAQAAKSKDQLNTERTQLDVKEIEARIDQGNKDRQFQLDQQAADFLRNLKGEELGVKQYSAETDRIKAKLSANAQAESNRIKEQYNQGKLTQGQLNLKLKAIRIRDQRRAAARTASGGGNGAKLTQDASKFLTSWNNDTLTAQGLTGAPQGDVGIAYARSAVSKLRGFAPGLKVGQAYSMLAGILPGDVMSDQRIINAITASFK